MPEPGGDTPGCLSVGAMFLVLAAPVYLLLRYFVRLVRSAYGFDEPVEDDDMRLRVCASCHNTVLEADYQHCPYCGAELPPLPSPADERGDE